MITHKHLKMLCDRNNNIFAGLFNTTRMKYLSLFALMIFINLLHTDGCHGSPYSSGIIVNTGSGIWLVDNYSLTQELPHLDLNPADSDPIGQGEKVETVVVGGPASNFSKAKQVSSVSLPVIIYAKKESSIISYQEVFRSGNPDISPMIKTLRI